MKTLVAFTCACTMWTVVGCVSQQTYDTARGEVEQLRRTLEKERVDVQDLEQEIASLHSTSQQSETELATIRTAIQRALDLATLTRQRADEKLAALQTQVAYLVNQSRSLSRELSDARQESASLQASVSRYKSELDELRPFPRPVSTMPMQPTAPTPVPLTASTPVPTLPPAATPAAAPAQPAQDNAGAATRPPVIRPTKTAPTEVDDSWTGMVKGWVSSLWDWIFG